VRAEVQKQLEEARVAGKIGSSLQAEVEIRRAMGDVPVTVFRPSIIVGDSRSGEIDRFAGPYYFMVAIVNAKADIPILIPQRSHAPLNLVPVDYVVDVAHRIAHDGKSVGKTYHLVDPNPLSARHVYQLVSEKAGIAEADEPVETVVTAEEEPAEQQAPTTD